MNKQQTQIIITAGLIGFLALLIAGNLKEMAKKKNASGNAAKDSASQEAIKPAQPQGLAKTAPAPEARDENAAKKIDALQKERALIAWGRNPFSALKVSQEFQKAHLELKGISVGKDKKAFAFINTEIVKQGDNLGAYEVMEIEKDKVLLRKDEQSFYITLPEE